MNMKTIYLCMKIIILILVENIFKYVKLQELLKQKIFIMQSKFNN